MAGLGRYELHEVLGQGGFATVYRGHDPVLDRDVAIKILHAHLAGDAQMAERFVREGRALARIKHPNLVQVYDAGTVDGQTFLAMELVPGRTLAALANGGQLPLDQVSAAVTQVAGAIDAVHLAGLLHRDIKPANILVEPNGRAVLLDLGIARDLESTSFTATGLLVGTPGYLAPEQVDSSIFVGPSTDVYQLAATAYTLLAGRPPYEGDTAQVLYAVAHTPAPDIGKSCPNLPYSAVAAIASGLAKDPKQRPPTAAAFALQLAGERPTVVAAPPSVADEAATMVSKTPLATPRSPVVPVAASSTILAAGPDRTATTIPPEAAPPTPGAQAAPPASRPASDAKPSRRPLLIAAAVGLIAVVAVAAFLLLSGGGSDKTADASSDATAVSSPASGSSSPGATGSGTASAAASGDLAPGAAAKKFSFAGDAKTGISFTAPRPETVSFQIKQSDAGAYFRVVDQNDQVVGPSSWIGSGGGFIEPVKLPNAGAYRLEIEPEKGKGGGTAAIALYEVPTPTPQKIEFEKPLELSVSVPGGIAVAQIDAKQGQRLTVDVTDASDGFYLRATLNGSTSTVARPPIWMDAGDEGFIDAFEVPKTGTYSIIVDPDQASVVKATLTIHEIGADKSTPMVFGTSSSFTTTHPGENAEFTFTGKHGRVVAVRLSKVHGGSYLRIQRAGEDRIIQSVWAGPTDGNLLIQVLPADDDYVVTVDPDGPKTETANITGYDITEPATATTTIGGGPVTVATTLPGQHGLIGFDGKANQSIIIESKGTEGAYATLLTSGGDPIGPPKQWLSANGALGPYTLPTAGRYFIRLELDGMDPAAITLQVTAR